MLVVMRKGAGQDEVRGVVAAVEARGFKAPPIPGAQRTAIGITGNKGVLEAPAFESLPGVLEVIRVSHAYKLVSREVKEEDTVVDGTGRREKVVPLSRAAAAVGADGLMVEVHHDPDRALSDGPQSITPQAFEKMMGELRQIAPVLGRRL